MFQTLGKFASRYAGVVVAVWLLLLITTFFFVPEWSSVAENGELAFLPPNSPSIVAEKMFRERFPNHTGSSNIVLVIRRETSDDGLREEDTQFIANVLVARLAEIFELDPATGLRKEDASEEAKNSLVEKMYWRGTRNVGSLYDSEDGKASLIVLELKSEFLDQANSALIERIEEEIDLWRRVPQQRRSRDESSSASDADVGDAASAETSTAQNIDPPNNGSKVKPTPIPQGLDITFSGTATYGRDSIREADRSGRATEKWTVILVVVLLLLMYRAPLLAIIPLLTVAFASALSLNLLTIAAKFGLVRLFNGIEPYITVLVYGAGVDYCLFLIARYREQLDNGDTIEEAISVSLTRVGSALAASAGTTMCGIGMMAFALFGKFQQAGIAIAFGLFICLCTSLTLAPAVLRIFGRWAFWPNLPLRDEEGSRWVSQSGILSHLMKLRLLNDGWQRMGALLSRRPRAFWLGSILAMLPFAIAGIALYGDLSYGLLTDLPPTAASVRGARALQAHYPGGEGVPVRVLLEVPGQNFSRIRRRPPADLVALHEAILANREELGIQSVRSLVDPTGGRNVDVPSLFLKNKALKDYTTPEHPTVTRLDLVFSNDAFSRTSIQEFRNMQQKLRDLLPESMQDATLSFAGETAGLSDLKSVTDRDRTFVNSLVVLVVFIILWILLRRPWLCGYLMVTVLFSYFATLGCTFLFFWALDPAGFAGLDWKVPMFLFTILIAVGEDYNIFLITRIEEETRVHGPVQGIVVALERTGSIISSCGIIMAGTFSSLMAGSLMGMDQLGFALALGVILDTFVVRPIMVPAFLIMLARRKERRSSGDASNPAADAAAASS
ncbi:MAG: hypothetical protein Fues2KO_03660 [Fuerstiella sp.]